MNPHPGRVEACIFSGKVPAYSIVTSPKKIQVACRLPDCGPLRPTPAPELYKAPHTQHPLAKVESNDMSRIDGMYAVVSPPTGLSWRSSAFPLTKVRITGLQPLCSCSVLRPPRPRPPRQPAGWRRAPGAFRVTITKTVTSQSQSRPARPRMEREKSGER